VKSVGYQERNSVPVPGRPQFCRTVSISDDQTNVAIVRRALRRSRNALEIVSCEYWEGERIPTE
jgi:NRPS condensation-like uncharacterized protein